MIHIEDLTDVTPAIEEDEEGADVTLAIEDTGEDDEEDEENLTGE